MRSTVCIYLLLVFTSSVLCAYDNDGNYYSYDDSAAAYPETFDLPEEDHLYAIAPYQVPFTLKHAAVFTVGSGSVLALNYYVASKNIFTENVAYFIGLSSAVSMLVILTHGLLTSFHALNFHLATILVPLSLPFIGLYFSKDLLLKFVSDASLAFIFPHVINTNDDEEDVPLPPKTPEITTMEDLQNFLESYRKKEVSSEIYFAALRNLALAKLQVSRKLSQEFYCTAAVPEDENFSTVTEFIGKLKEVLEEFIEEKSGKKPTTTETETKGEKDQQASGSSTAETKSDSSTETKSDSSTETKSDASTETKSGSSSGSSSDGKSDASSDAKSGSTGTDQKGSTTKSTSGGASTAQPQELYGWLCSNLDLLNSIAHVGKVDALLNEKSRTYIALFQFDKLFFAYIKLEHFIQDHEQLWSEKARPLMNERLDKIVEKMGADREVLAAIRGDIIAKKSVEEVTRLVHGIFNLEALLQHNKKFSASSLAAAADEVFPADDEDIRNARAFVLNTAMIMGIDVASIAKQYGIIREFTSPPPPNRVPRRNREEPEDEDHLDTSSTAEGETEGDGTGSPSTEEEEPIVVDVAPPTAAMPGGTSSSEESEIESASGTSSGEEESDDTTTTTMGALPPSATTNPDGLGTGVPSASTGGGDEYPTKPIEEHTTAAGPPPPTKKLYVEKVEPAAAGGASTLTDSGGGDDAGWLAGPPPAFGDGDILGPTLAVDDIVGASSAVGLGSSSSSSD